MGNSEARATVLLGRKTGEDSSVYGPDEIRGGYRVLLRHVGTIFWRRFYIFFTEPIVLWLSLLSGFSDALIFTFLESFGPVYEQWGFGIVGTGLAFPAYPAQLLCRLRLVHAVDYQVPQAAPRASWPRSPPPKQHDSGGCCFSRRWKPLCLFGFAWTLLGPYYGILWIAPMIFSAMMGIANYATCQSSIYYQTAAYGPYASSVTGGNDLARKCPGLALIASL
ncbi:hypothetical protein ACJQWK_09297 [Exserohilum turcicum]